MDRYLPIPFNKTYFACSNGKIYNKRGKEIGSTKKSGYTIVYIKHRDTNKFIGIYAHRLIWEVFNGEIPEGMEIDHINTNRSDNRLENLRIVNHRENCNNSKSIEKYRISNKGKGFCSADYISTRIKGKVLSEETKKKIAEAKSKKVYQYTLDGELVKIWKSARECGRNGFNQGHVSACCRGIEKKYKGYKWLNNPI